MQRIRKDDFVEVISGRDKGRRGKVLQVFPTENKAIVEGAGVVKRHQKAGAAGGPAGIVEKNMKIHLSKILPVDGKTGKASRIRIQEVDGKKVRILVKSGEPLDKAQTA